MSQFAATDSIDRIARLFARPMSRRRAAGLVAAGLVSTSVPAAVQAAGVCTDSADCDNDEMCLSGYCSIAIPDGPEMLDCPRGQQRVNGRCRKQKDTRASRRRRNKSTRRD